MSVIPNPNVKIVRELHNGMPADRRKKTKTPEHVPDAGDPDRKRVLNVLAQRRYRQKRRERIAALEAQARAPSPQRSSNEKHDEGVRIRSDHTTSLSSGPSSEDSGQVEDIVRQIEADGCLDMTFGLDTLDMQLFPGLGKCVVYRRFGIRRIFKGINLL